MLCLQAHATAPSADGDGGSGDDVKKDDDEFLPLALKDLSWRPGPNENPELTVGSGVVPAPPVPPGATMKAMVARQAALQREAEEDDAILCTAQVHCSSIGSKSMAHVQYVRRGQMHGSRYKCCAAEC